MQCLELPLLSKVSDVHKILGFPTKLSFHIRLMNSFCDVFDFVVGTFVRT